MDVFFFIAAFLLVNRVYKSLKFSPLRFKWKSMLVTAQWVLVIVYVVFAAVFNTTIKEFLCSSILLGVVWYIGKEEDFKSFKAYIQAHYPLIAVGFLSALTRLVALKFYDEYDEYFVLAIVGAFIYIFGRWATYKKQDDELKFFTQRNNELDRLVADALAVPAVLG